MFAIWVSTRMRIRSRFRPIPTESAQTVLPARLRSPARFSPNPSVVQNVFEHAQFHSVGDVLVGCHLQQLASHLVGRLFETLARFACDGWCSPAVVSCPHTRPPAIASRLHRRIKRVAYDWTIGAAAPMFGNIAREILAVAKLSRIERRKAHDHSSKFASAGNIVFGMEDGTVSIFGLVFGVAASAPNGHAVLLAGATGAAAAAVSMMAGTYLDVSTANDRAQAEQQRKRLDIEQHTAREAQDVDARLTAAGFTAAERASIVCP
jgi:hypothetical protein